jgi:hypothetical protein
VKPAIGVAPYRDHAGGKHHWRHVRPNLRRHAPWLIPIGLKTLFDDQRPTASPLRSVIALGRKGVTLPLFSDVFENEVRQLDHKPPQPGVLLEQRQHGNVVTSI